MLNFIKNLFKGSSVDYGELASRGAQIIDVRSPAEFKSGHIKKSKNIPLQQLQSQLSKLDKSKPVITCCASGMRSASAKSILKTAGYEAYNGGGWNALEQKLK